MQRSVSVKPGVKRLRLISKIISERKYPVGSTDNGGRWYPADQEACSCCNSVRGPSRTWPWSLWKHCKTAKHVRHRLIEKPRETEKEALAMTAEEAPLHLESGDILLQETARAILRGEC